MGNTAVLRATSAAQTAAPASNKVKRVSSRYQSLLLHRVGDGPGPSAKLLSPFFCRACDYSSVQGWSVRVSGWNHLL